MQRLSTIPKNIIFDFGGVLADIDIDLAVRSYERIGVGPIDVKDIHPYNSGIFLAFEKGLISPDEFLGGLRKIAARDVTDQQLTDIWNSIILPYRYERFRPLLKLKETGHRVFLLSNTNLLHHIYFEGVFDRENPFGMKFKDFFDAVYYSDEMKMRKPDKEIYESVLEQQNLDASDTIFIDDNAINLNSPRELGMQVCHFTREDTVAGLFGFAE